MSNNGTLTVLESAARTVETTSEAFSNLGARGILLVVNTPAVAATAEITPSIQAYDYTSGAWYTIWTAAAAISTETGSSYLLYPGASGGNFVEVDGIPLPARWRLSVAVANAEEVTYSVGAHLLI